MKNNIYEMLNDTEFNFDTYERLEFNDIEKRRIKDSFKNLKNERKVNCKRLAAGFAVALVVSIGFFSTEAGAKVIATFTKSIESFLNINKNIDDYKTTIDKTITDNGFSITLNEVIFDDDKLIISKNITSDIKLNDEDFCDAREMVYVNGKEIRFSSASGGDEVIDEYTRQIVTKCNLSELEDIDLSEDLDVKIVYKNITLFLEYSPQDIRGNWEFDIKVNKDSVRNTIESNKIIKLQSEFILPNGEKIILEKYKSNDIEQRIYAIRETDTCREEYDIRLKGNDDLGNEVLFYYSEGTEDKYVFQYFNGERNIDKNATKLKLKPYAIKFEDLKYDYDYEQIGEEFVIDLNN